MIWFCCSNAVSLHGWLHCGFSPWSVQDPFGNGAARSDLAGQASPDSWFPK